MIKKKLKENYFVTWKLHEFKVYNFIENTVVFIHLCIVCVCFCATTAELGSFYRDPVVLYRSLPACFTSALTNINFLESSWQCATLARQIVCRVTCLELCDRAWTHLWAFFVHNAQVFFLFFYTASTQEMLLL